MLDILHKHRKPYMITLSLFLLSLADAGLIDFGLRHAVITELNSIMNYVYYRSIFLFYLLKILLPAALIFCVPYAFSIGIVKRLLSFTVIIYFSVFIYHLGWSTYVFLLYW